MSSATLALDGLLAVATAIMFAYAGVITGRRPVEDRGSRLAKTAFASWWFGLAVYTLLGALREFLALGGDLDATTHSAINDLGVVPLIVLLWGLVAYLAYIYTGRPGAIVAVTILHAIILVYYLYVEFTLTASGVRVQDWAVPIDYTTALTPVESGLVLVTILLPALVASVLYGSLFFRVRERTARYRIATVSGAFLLWFGTAAVASVTPLGAWYWWPLAARLVGLVATVLVLLAYLPPRWVQARYGIAPVESAASPAASPALRLVPA